MGATQGVLLLMMGALALYLMWNSKSPFNKGNDGGTPNWPSDPNGGPPFSTPETPGAGKSFVPDQYKGFFCIGTIADFQCGPYHFVNGILIGSGQSSTIR